MIFVSGRSVPTGRVLNSRMPLAFLSVPPRPNSMGDKLERRCRRLYAHPAVFRGNFVNKGTELSRVFKRAIFVRRKRPFGPFLF